MDQGRWKVYFNEYNVLMEGTTYLPLVSGLLRSHAETFPEICTGYEFMPFLFCREPADRILSHYENPAVAAFSVFMWNEQLSLTVAAELKRRYPDCLVIFGGQQVPHEATEYLVRHPFLDIAVRGEGEETFSAILRQNRSARAFHDIPNIVWRDRATDRVICNPSSEALNPDLDRYPSPYLNGQFDALLERHPEISFQAILQTNRGCPYTCAYCSWHKAAKLRYFSLERVAAEIDWCGSHGIKYVFNADANFGIHQRDLQIADLLATTKSRYGYPEKFRSCFTKNADNRIYDLATTLLTNGLEKGITLSFQSLSETALHNIRRQNIRLSTYRNLLSRFNQANVPVYTELILGLPGETGESWIAGIGQIFEAGLKGQLFIYPCEVYPNSEMGDPGYRQQYGIVTRQIPLTEIHGATRDDDLQAEYQDIIVATASMPLAEWRRMMVLSWLTMTLFSMKLCFYLLAYLRQRFAIAAMDFIQYLMESEEAAILRQEVAFYNSHLDRLLAGGTGRGVVMPDFGKIYWDMEEASFIRIAQQRQAFYRELLPATLAYCQARAIPCDGKEVEEAILFQELHIPGPSNPVKGDFPFQWNFPEFFHRLLTTGDAELRQTRQVLRVSGIDFQHDRARFAREVILWGRKSDHLLNKTTWVALHNGGRKGPTEDAWSAMEGY